MFKAGRLNDFIDEWSKITNDQAILNIVKGVKIEMIDTDDQIPRPNVRPSVFSNNEHAIVKQEIDKLIGKNVILETINEPDDFISTIFLRPKKDGTHRMILNLKQFNQYVVYHHFKMDTLEHAVQLMTPGCYMASVDLKDAYYTVPIYSVHQKFLKFWFDDKFYQYTCLPNGLASAPRLFTKLLKPVYSTLRSMGHVSSAYIDDSYLQGDTYNECYNNVVDTVKMLSSLGFCVHPVKSVFIPTQQLVFLGFILDSVAMTVTPTDEKKERIVSACSLMLANTNPTIRDLAELIGTLVSNFPGAEFGPLHYRDLERDKYQALILARGNYENHIKLSIRAISEIKWWLRNAQYLKRDIVRNNPDVELKSDASNLGWGAVFGEKRVGGRWLSSEAKLHINVLELKAAFFALKCFCTDMKNQHVRISIDNTTAVSYINNMGGSKSPLLNALAIKVWDWCIARNLWVSAVHIAGKLNVEADEKSRKFNDRHEWQINEQCFNEIIESYPSLNIDMFASRLNNMLNVYCSWKPDPNSAYVDAFSVNWSNFEFYAFPPFSLVSKCLNKIIKDKARGIMIVPLWPSQTWFPTLLQHLYQQPWIYRPRINLLMHPSHREPHPLCRKLRLMVCPLSGNGTDSYNFQQTLPMFSWHPGDQRHINNTTRTSKSGCHFVIKNKLILIPQR